MGMKMSWPSVRGDVEVHKEGHVSKPGSNCGLGLGYVRDSAPTRDVAADVGAVSLI